MKNKIISICVSLVIVFLTLGLDQWTKWAITKTFALHERMEIISHFFSLTYVQNTGAGFSLFEDFGILFFALLTIAALVVIIYMFVRSSDVRAQLCLALVFSGALGNFIDRLRFGYVRDFLSFRIFGWDFRFQYCGYMYYCRLWLFDRMHDYDEIQERKRWRT